MEHTSTDWRTYNRWNRRDERMARRGGRFVRLIRKRTMHHAETSDASFRKLPESAVLAP